MTYDCSNRKLAHYPKKYLYFTICLILVRALYWLQETETQIKTKERPTGSQNQSVEKTGMELHQEGLDPRHQCHLPSALAVFYVSVSSTQTSSFGTLANHSSGPITMAGDEMPKCRRPHREGVRASSVQIQS